MKKSEIAKLLAVAAEVDRQPVTSERVEVWFVLVGHLEFGPAAEAVSRHFQTSERWLMPVHVIEGVAALLNEQAWEPPALTADERALCSAAGVPAEEFVERRDDTEWIAHLRSKWLGIEQ